MNHVQERQGMRLRWGAWAAGLVLVIAAVLSGKFAVGPMGSVRDGNGAGRVTRATEGHFNGAHMDERQFWSMIEQAWQEVDGAAASRRKLAQGELEEEDAAELADRSLIEFVPALRTALERLPREELLEFDRILERKLYEIDRAEIQEHTDGSDDGFLYARGFIVAAGQAYYDAVDKDPSRALMDLECEDMCYLSMHVFTEKFGEMPDSGISRETGSNQAGWRDAGR